MKNFDFFSLDYVYYPVSGIMWVWHKVFGLALGDSNPWAWVLSVIFLVFTLRSLLFKPFMGQMNSQMKMQAVAPELKKLREKYKDDKTRLAEEMQKFNKEAGVNPLGGCLPALIQAPVFIGLFHVLRSFKPNQQENYFFGASDVSSFVHAKLLGGAPLSSYMTQPWVSTAKQIGLGPDGLNGVRSTVIAVGIPLTILAGIATFLSSRRSIARQQQMQGSNEPAPQAAIMNKLMQYVFPLFVVVGGPFFPLAILFYWLSNNTWTFGQLYVAHRIQDKKIAAESMVVDQARDASKFTKPPPGARPVRTPGARPVTGARPLTGPRPAPGSRPVTGAGPTGNAQPPAGAKKPVEGARKPPTARPTSAAKRPVIQPSTKSSSTPANGSVDGSTNGSANGSAQKSNSSINGSAEGGRVAPVAGAGPSLTKSGPGAGGPNGTPSDLPSASVADSPKPPLNQTAAKKKKPGRR